MKPRVMSSSKLPTLASTWLCLASAPAHAQFYTDTGSPTNPPWNQILPTLNVDSADPGPVNGSTINVNNTATEIGFYGNRPLSVGTRRIHVCCNTSTTNLTAFSRWYQQDGNTEIFRLFVNDENTSSTRANAARSESFTLDRWRTSDNVTYEWTGRYTIAKRQQSHAIFQVKNNDDDWAVQLNVTSTGKLLVNNRRATDVTVPGPDGLDRIFDGQGFDARIQDDGHRYKVWIDGTLLADEVFTRGDVAGNENNFRWGKYMGDAKLIAPSDHSIILVSGAQTRSWPGNLSTAVTDIQKANNAQNLQNTASWSGGVTPGIHQRATWGSAVNATNSTATLSAEQSWGGIKITNPAAQVTINGSATLGIDRYGLDMSTATRNLVVNCPVEARDTSTWNLATGRTATFNGIVRGLAGITSNGNGTVILTAANTYSGPTTINGGTLQLGNGSTTGSLNTNSTITVATGARFAVNRSNTVTQGTHFSPEPITGGGGITKAGSGQLTLTAANTYTGPTTISGGTLAFTTTIPFANTSSISLADGTLLRPTIAGANISAPITLGPAATTASISAPTNQPGAGMVSTLTLGSPINGPGNVTFTSSADQNALSTISLNAASTYTGNTLLDTSGTSATQIILRLGTTNALPINTTLTIDGQPGTGTGRWAELNLNGFNQQLARLTNIPRDLRNQRVVNSNTSAPATLTILNNTNHSFSGSLGGSANGSVSGSAMPGSSNGNNFALIKNGTATFTIAGTHSYSGNTTVTQGTLELNSPNPNNQTSTLSIAATGARLKLSFTGTDTIQNLLIGTTPMPPGTYKAPNNPATGIPLSQLDGTGTLTITQGPAASFNTWKTIHGPDQTIDGDHDNDGIKNGIEFFLGGLASNHGVNPPSTITHNEGAPRNITWTKASDYPGTYGTHFVIETSTTLTGTWTREPLGSNLTIIGNEVTYTFPTTTGKAFARLQVTGP